MLPMSEGKPQCLKPIRLRVASVLYESHREIYMRLDRVEVLETTRRPNCGRISNPVLHCVALGLFSEPCKPSDEPRSQDHVPVLLFLRESGEHNASFLGIGSLEIASVCQG